MKNFLIATTIILSVAFASAQPVVTQISNAASASFSIPGPVNGTIVNWLTLPNGSIAQGSYFSVYGNGLAAGISTCGSNYANCLWQPYPLPTSIQGTSVSVTIGSNAAVNAYIEFAAQVSATAAQINAVMPSNTPVGSGTLTVTYNGQQSAPVPINVVASSFGTFTVNQAGSGPGVITDTSYNALTPFHTAKPGDYVLLWGTGLGPAADPSTEQSAPPQQVNLCASGSSCPVSVWVGGKSASVPYAGRASFTAEDQVVFIVPAGLGGCYVPVAVVVGGVTSNFTTMPVDPNGADCSDTNGVGMSYISSLLNGGNGSATVGVIGLSSQLWNVNLGGGDFFPWDYDTVSAQMGDFTIAPLELFQGFTQAPSVGSCTANTYLGYPPPVDPGLNYVTNLDAGSALSIAGPASSTVQPVPQVITAGGSLGGYFGVVGGIPPKDGVTNFDSWPSPPFFWLSTANGDGTYTVGSIASGNYTVTGLGGKDIGPFTGTINVSAAAASFQWSNSDQFANQNNLPQFSRQTPLTITWTGGDPSVFMDILLIGSTTEEVSPSVITPEPAVQVECVVPSAAGTFTVPTYVLQALPVGYSGVSMTGAVLVGPISAPEKISPPPSGLDVAYLYYQILSGYTVQWQ
jgi:uncharacterized protein (TIGR03437 family)